MSYIRLGKKYFILLLVFVLSVVGSRISKAKMTGKVATTSNIDEMLEDLKSYYKDSLFSDDKMINQQAWTKQRHDIWNSHVKTRQYLGKVFSSDDQDSFISYFSTCTSNCEFFCCCNTSSWCLNWLEDKGFICGLLLIDSDSFFSKPETVCTSSGFHWAVILPVYVKKGVLSVRVVTPGNWVLDNGKRLANTIDWNDFAGVESWKNFVVFKEKELCEVGKENSCKMKAMHAPSWVWNVMKNLGQRKTEGAREWLVTETEKLNGFLKSNEMSFGVWPCIVPFNREIHDDPGEIGKTVNSILEIPSIKDSVFDASCLPEFDKLNHLELFYENFAFLYGRGLSFAPLCYKNKRIITKGILYENEYFHTNEAIWKKISVLMKKLREVVDGDGTDEECEITEESIRSRYARENNKSDDPKKTLEKAKEIVAELKEKSLPKRFHERHEIRKSTVIDNLYFEILLPESKRNELFPHK